jgi:hypothetical protein
MTAQFFAPVASPQHPRTAFADRHIGPSPDERDRMLAEMFQSLGHVIHHIQDMAQPQHTRNDAHPPIAGRGAYEAWSRKEMRAGQLPVAGYSVDHNLFDSPFAFWSSGRKGIADSSRRTPTFDAAASSLSALERPPRVGSRMQRVSGHSFRMISVNS